MTEPAPNIPWHNIARHLEYEHANPANKDTTDLYLRGKAEQGHDLNAFVQDFEQAIEKASAAARAQYPATYAAPGLDEVVVSDQTMEKMLPILERINGLANERKGSFSVERIKILLGRPCSLMLEDGLSSPVVEDSLSIPVELRRMKNLLAPYEVNDCYDFEQVNGKAYDTTEIIKVLLLLNEMDTLFRICAHPDNDLISWWTVRNCYCVEFSDLGWDHICKNALKVYICLNVMRCCSGSWMSTEHNKQKDYRHTASYQKTLRETTRTTTVDSEIPCILHQDFFGIDDLHLTPVMPGEPDYLPSSDEIATARDVLYRTKLPAELQMMIIEYVEEGSQGRRRRLNIPCDPLHQANREELLRYLDECWRLLVNCDMMVTALGDQIPWRALVSHLIADLWIPVETPVDDDIGVQRVRRPVSDEWSTTSYIQRRYPRPPAPHQRPVPADLLTQDDFFLPCGRLALEEYSWYDFL